MKELVFSYTLFRNALWIFCPTVLLGFVSWFMPISTSVMMMKSTVKLQLTQGIPIDCQEAGEEEEESAGALQWNLVTSSFSLLQVAKGAGAVRERISMLQLGCSTKYTFSGIFGVFQYISSFSNPIQTKNFRHCFSLGISERAHLNQRYAVFMRKQSMNWARQVAEKILLWQPI